MPGYHKITDAQVEKALVKHCGIKNQAAKSLKVTRQAIQARVDKSPHLQAVLAEVEEVVLDMVDGIILKDLKRGCSQTAKWLAERKGKKRGYGTKIEADIRLSETDIAALVTAFGGDISAMRAFHARLAGTDPDPNSTGYPPAR